MKLFCSNIYSVEMLKALPSKASIESISQLFNKNANQIYTS